MLKPILNEDKKIDILFIPLNPAEESSEQGHYFAANEIFWPSLKESKLINAHFTRVGYENKKGKNSFLFKIENRFADTVIFKESLKNLNNLVFSICDLAPDVVGSKGAKVIITQKHVKDMFDLISRLIPKIAVVMHARVRDEFLFSFRNDVFKKFNEEEFQNWTEHRNKFKEINPQLTLDWGPFGKVIPGIETTFFCIPFPSTQNGTLEQNVQYWKSCKEFIDEMIGKNGE